MIKLVPPPLDIDLFYKLYYILLYTVNKGKRLTTARALGISTRTMILWEKNPPIKQGWWTTILKILIKEAIRVARIQNKNTLAKNLINELSQADSQTLEDIQLSYPTANREVVTHLLRLLNNNVTVSTRQLKTPAFSNGYSLRSFRFAADHINLPRYTEGFGKDKVTFYHLPE